MASREVEGLSKKIGRWLKREAASEDERISKILMSRTWTLVFNPQSTHGSKKITFKDNGEVGLGRNQNESTWRITNGLLEMLNSEGRVFSRFIYDKRKNEFLHTNDEDTLSIRSQEILPHGE